MNELCFVAQCLDPVVAAYTFIPHECGCGLKSCVRQELLCEKPVGRKKSLLGRGTGLWVGEVHSGNDFHLEPKPMEAYREL